MWECFIWHHVLIRNNCSCTFVIYNEYSVQGGKQSDQIKTGEVRDYHSKWFLLDGPLPPPPPPPLPLPLCEGTDVCMNEMSLSFRELPQYHDGALKRKGKSEWQGTPCHYSPTEWPISRFFSFFVTSVAQQDTTVLISSLQNNCEHTQISPASIATVTEIDKFTTSFPTARTIGTQNICLSLDYSSGR